MLQQPDALGNRVLDYTAAGYRGGTVPIPHVPVKTTVSPVAGDDRATIQAAIDAVEALPTDTNGFRGAVLLTAGEYQINGTLTVNSSGVVLRGQGSGTNDTVLRATATNQHTLIRFTGSGSAATVNGTTRNITNNYVPVGATSFQVDSTEGLAVGDRVFVRRIATDQWITELGMDLLGPPPDVNPWTPGGYHMDMDRIITRIEVNRIFINAPITCAIEARHAGGTIRKYTWSSRIQHCGIEHLRGVSDFAGTDDEEHGWVLVQFNSIEHAWARNVISQNFGFACVALYGGTLFTTVSDCRSLDPVSIVTGGRRYAFVMDDCSLCLVQNCYTDDDRHQFVTQSLTTGPNVFVDGLSESARSDAGPHHRWGTGAIWDCVTVSGHQLNVRNRGNSGSGHGWAGANEVVWNCQASSYVVQNPPGAHNWLIGSVGTLSSSTSGAVGPAPPGTYDSHGSNVFPNSLYYAQLQDRLAAPNLQTREYWLGEITRFTNSTAPGEAVSVDAAWRTAVQTAAAGAAVNGFDVAAGNQWVPFTFNLTLAPNEQIIAATLSLAMRAANSASANDGLYLDSLTNAFTFANLGWNPISTVATNPTVKVLDLSAQIELLMDGRLNVALQNDTGIDWALLELRVAPVLAGGTNVLYPAADATVRGGASASSNFGTATTLTVKEDSSNDNDRRAVLRWDLSSITGTVYQVRLRLTPVNVGTNGIEQGVAFTTNDSWSENAVTWNNQPVAGKRFATWLSGVSNAVEVVVTPQVQEALAGDGQFSVSLYSIRNFGANGQVDYAAREHPDAKLRPQLRLFMPSAPPFISDLTNRTTAVNATTGPIPFTIGDSATPAANLVLTGQSSNTNLVPLTNLVFGGSGPNRTVTIAPAPNQSGHVDITITVTDEDDLAASETFTLTVGSHPPGVFVWNGPGAGTNNWSESGHWIPAGPPEAFDDVKFLDAGAVGGAVSPVNNFADVNFGGTVASLQFANTNGSHTTLIADGHGLNVSGGLTVGTESDNGSSQTVHATMTGSYAALHLSGGHLIVRQATDPSNGSQRATLDLSGLGMFSAAVNRIIVGCEGVFARPTGTLLLARTNTITASGSTPAIAIGGSGGGSGNAGGLSHFQLGYANEIFANSISVGRGKQGFSGNQASSLRFQPAYTNANPELGAMAIFRAADGFSRITTWNIADAQSGGGTVNTAGACDFTGGTVDALVNSMIVGRSSTGSGAGNPVGTLTLHGGTIDVNSLQLGLQGSAGANSGNNSATGTVNVNGGLLRVNSSLQLGVTAGGGGAAGTRGVLNVNGGAVGAISISTGGGTNNTITLNGGALFLTNTAGPGINAFALTNSSLTFHQTDGSPRLIVTNLITGGAVNTIHLAALPPGFTAPAQFPLVKYTALSGAGMNFVLGSLPPGPACGGYLSNNTFNATLDVVLLANCPTPQPQFTALSFAGADLVFSGGNGVPGRGFELLVSTNLMLALEFWTVASSGVFDFSGQFTFTNLASAGDRSSFFRLRLLP